MLIMGERKAIVDKVFCRRVSRFRFNVLVADEVDSAEVNSTSEMTSTDPHRDILLLSGVAKNNPLDS